MRLIICLALYISPSLGQLDEYQEFEKMMSEPKDKSNWVDPLDMGLSKNKHEDCCPEVQKKLEKCNKDLSNLKQSVTNESKESLSTNSTSTKQKTETEVFLRRHVNHLLSILNLESETTAHLKVEVYFSPFDIQTLKNFVSLQSSVHAVDVDHVLNSYIKSYETLEHSPWLETIKDNLSDMRDPLVTILLSVSLVYVIMSVFRSLHPLKVLVLLFLVCWIWHWISMYKGQWAVKRSKLMQSIDIPSECRPQDMTWYQSISSAASSMFNQMDKCEEYHKAMLVDPIFEVNPLSALVDFLVKLFLSPLGSVGKEVGAMFNGLLGEIPFLWKIPILIIFVILMMFFMIILAGYEVRLPLFLGKIGPASNASQKHTESLEMQIKELKCMLESQSQPMLTELPSKRLKLESDTRSGVEDLIPLRYDCMEKKHTQEKSSNTLKNTKQISKEKPENESEPLIQSVDSDSNKEIKQTDAVEIKSFHSSLQKSPMKKLSVRNCVSPKLTKFEWISQEDIQESQPNSESTNDPEPVTLSKKIEFSDEVEKIFSRDDL